MNNMAIYNKLRKVPENAQSTIPDGPMKGLTSVKPMWRIKRLTEVFGPCGYGWKYTVREHWIETNRVNDTVCTFVMIDLYVKHDDEWSEAIPGIGGSKMATRADGIHVDDECFKMALTDAISVAAKSLGVGADVYFPKDVDKYVKGKTDQRDIHKRTELITNDQIEILKAEINRTGVPEKTILRTYEIDRLENMTSRQFIDCKKRLLNTPTKKGEENE